MKAAAGTFRPYSALCAHCGVTHALSRREAWAALVGRAVSAGEAQRGIGLVPVPLVNEHLGRCRFRCLGCEAADLAQSLPRYTPPLPRKPRPPKAKAEQLWLLPITFKED